MKAGGVGFGQLERNPSVNLTVARKRLALKVMLTADLAQSWQRGGRTGPRLVDPDDEKLLREAAELLAVFGEHEGHARGALETTLREYVGTGTDYKIMRGLIKLLTDRCEFAVGGEVEPQLIRRALFLKARGAHPVVSGEAARSVVVAEAAAELHCAPEAILAGLYGDLPEQQKLTEFAALQSPRHLLDLYNLAQAQALLYRCVRMRLWVEPQEPGGYRELFSAIKTYRLIHTIKGNARDGYEIALDGPVSMFHRSQKYGVQMAVFLPALLLCRHWRMRAEIASQKHGHSVHYELDSEQRQLRSHYLDLPGYQNPVRDRLIEKWQTRATSAWTLEPSGEVVAVGASALIPDFVLRHEATGGVVYLEILGFWTPKHLKERAAELSASGVRNFLLAAWEELRGSREELTLVPAQTIVFKRQLDPALVELAAEKLLAADD